MTAKKNFNIFYEIDGEEVGSVLRVDEYGGDEHFSWVNLMCCTTLSRQIQP